MKFKVGDKVKTKYGIGEVIYDDNSDIPYLVGIHGFRGHSGAMFVNNEIAIKAGYKNECCYFREYELEPVEAENEIKYKYKIGDYVYISNGIVEIINYNRTIYNRPSYDIIDLYDESHEISESSIKGLCNNAIQITLLKYIKNIKRIKEAVFGTLSICSVIVLYAVALIIIILLLYKLIIWAL